MDGEEHKPISDEQFNEALANWSEKRKFNVALNWQVVALDLEDASKQLRKQVRVVGRAPESVTVNGLMEATSGEFFNQEEWERLLQLWDGAQEVRERIREAAGQIAPEHKGLLRKFLVAEVHSDEMKQGITP